ncbi:MAG: hydrogenase maturation protease [Candidatus Dormibacteria bacterium]
MTARMLVAGIGNIFLGDDAFGVAVIAELERRGHLQGLDGLTLRDYGIRGYDLAYELLEPYGAVVLVDASARGEPPGTVTVIEADPDAGVSDREAAPDHGQGAFQGHLMTPAAVFHLVRTMGGSLGRVLIVACEPDDLGPPDMGRMGLSAVVAAAVAPAADTVERLVRDLLIAPSLVAAPAATGARFEEVSA